MSMSDRLKTENNARFLTPGGAAGLLCILVLFFALSAVASAEDATGRFAKSCAGCHGADGAGTDVSPAIRGLSTDEVKTALVGYRDRTRGGSRKAIMERVARTLNDEDIEALADHVAGF